MRISHTHSYQRIWRFLYRLESCQQIANDTTAIAYLNFLLAFHFTIFVRFFRLAFLLVGLLPFLLFLIVTSTDTLKRLIGILVCCPFQFMRLLMLHPERPPGDP